MFLITIKVIFPGYRIVHEDAKQLFTFTFKDGFATNLKLRYIFLFLYFVISVRSSSKNQQFGLVTAANHFIL